jgi:hypothetical protein
MQLEISPEEKNMLVGLLEAALADIRVEVRRTRTPDFHDRLQRDEEQLETLLRKISSL